jgi:uncharacterized protein DUF6498
VRVTESADDRPGWLAATPWLIDALAGNAVALWGLLHGAWTLGSLLLFYWLTNLLNTVFVGARIWLHRTLTRKRGHWTGASDRSRTFLADFVTVNLVFTLAHGIFVGAFVFLILHLAPSTDDLRRGVLVLLGVMTTTLAMDSVTIGQRPFAWVRRRADLALGRMLVVHLGLIAGVFFLALTERPTTFFLAFVVLKLLLDVGTALPGNDRLPAEPPRYVRWVRAFGKPGEFDADWRRAVEAEQRKLSEAEEVLPR